MPSPSMCLVVAVMCATLGYHATWPFVIWLCGVGTGVWTTMALVARR